MRRPRRPRLQGLPFNRMIPNILTMMSLCAGLTSIQFGLQGRWQHAVLAFVAAAVLDGLDGRVARILKGASKFGAELDSLSDFVSFGVAPALLLYLWTMQDAGNFGWILVLLYSVSCGLRLARFNTNIDGPERPPWAYNFFTGVPAPAGAGLVLLPMVLSFEFGDLGFFDKPAVVAVFMVGVPILMVSRVPTFAFKSFQVANKWVLPTMLIAGMLAALLINAPWATLSLLAIVYLVSIPFSIRSFRNLEAKAGALQTKGGPSPEATDATSD